MNIIVLVKQVPDTSDIKLDPKTNTLVREGVRSIINPFDRFAIEEGIRLRERYGGNVTAISMGPPQAKLALQGAIAMGVDDALLISSRAFAGSDTWATSYTLAQVIRKIGDFDLIFCGKQASDGDTAQVGPGISAHLDIPQVTYVKKNKKDMKQRGSTHSRTKTTIREQMPNKEYRKPPRTRISASQDGRRQDDCYQDGEYLDD